MGVLSIQLKNLSYGQKNYKGGGVMVKRRNKRVWGVKGDYGVGRDAGVTGGGLRKIHRSL